MRLQPRTIVVGVGHDQRALGRAELTQRLDIADRYVAADASRICRNAFPAKATNR